MIGRLLGVRPGEGRIVLRLGGHFSLALAATTVYVTAAEAIFISVYPASRLPLVYLGGALFSTVISFFYERAGRRMGPIALSLVTVGYMAGILSLLTVAAVVRVPLAPFVLLLVAPSFGVLLHVENLALVSRALDIRAQRRLLSAVGVIGGFGAVGGGLLVGVVSRVVESRYLPWLAVGLVLATIAFARKGTGTHRKSGSGKPASWPTILRNRFALVLVLLVLVTGLLSTLVRYQLGAGLKHSDMSSAEMASFLGILNAALSGAAVVFQLFLGRSLIDRLGVGKTLGVYPALMVGAGAAAIVHPGLATATAGLFAERLIRQNLQRPIVNVATLPLPDAIRSRTALAVRGALEPLAVALASVAIVATAGVVPWQFVSWGITGIAVVGVLCAAMARRGYLRELTHALKGRRLRLGEDEEEEWPLDAKVREMLHEQLASRSPEKVVLALRLLRGRFDAETIRRVRDPWAKWGGWEKQEAIRAMSLDPIPAAVEFIRGLGQDEPAEVCAARYRFEGVPIAKEELEAVVCSGPPVVRAEALVRLARREGAPAIRGRLEAWAGSSDPAMKAAAATVIGEIGEEGWLDHLPSLVGDAPVEVSRVLARRPSPRFADLAADLLYDDRTYLHARDALVKMGEEALPALRRRIASASSAGRAIEVVGMVEGGEAKGFLLGLLAGEDEQVRYHAAKSLARFAKFSEEELGTIRRALEREIAECYRARAEEGASQGLLQEEAQERFESAAERVFLLLSLLHPARPFRRVFLSFVSRDKAQRSFALEALEEMLEVEWRKKLVPLLEGTETVAGPPAPPDRWGTRVRRVLEDPESDPSLQTAIRWKRGELFRTWRLRDLAALVEEAGEKDPRQRILLRDGEPYRLSEGILGKEIPPPPNGRVETVPLHAVYRVLSRRPRCASAWLRGLATCLLRPADGGAGLSRSAHSVASRKVGDAREEEDDLSLWERMFFLGTVPFFGATTPERLRLVAEISRIVPAAAGEIIVKEGRPGYHFYLVCQGTVEVRVRGKQVAILGGGEGFGEYALLTGDPRSATVQAVSPCDLLTIDQVDFLDLVHTHPSLAVAFTPVIAERALIS